MPKQPARKAPTLSLDPGLLEEARAYGVNVSRAAEAGVSEAVRAAKAEAWKRDNAEAIADWNAWAAEHGLPLERYRMF
ncbi:type II toxin-antitoxin system CcdA family antitoxin [Psychromarinibacter sp. C21-152]|uniref:Type II toxin-antitoxin system CcdA family antitoxin n=1 Tax=Psychromarinibacter sediminicola TaxID=3033385 RepID=A0AAE3TAF3_9RHOB|nr:type II toxin-antitoxin system CcdA family antitoxin [Psychromarinibacter sediminicola]MDF0602798.1 type II toxin-antitoxin system CcdA family antitoxin [Psychromarinibacter sediminicola]